MGMSGLLKSAVEMKVKLCLFSGDDQFHKCSGSERVQLSLVSENLAYKATCASEMGVFPLKIVSCVFTAQKTQNITDLQLPYTAVNFFGGKTLPVGLLWYQNLSFWCLSSLLFLLDSLFESMH